MTDKRCVQDILTHYHVHGRHDLPWRKQITPYKIIVSEIMLQQTQVARVKEKFTTWMKQYPTLLSLSKASLRDVLILWQGLGYQRRAKALLSIAEKYSRIPRTYEELCELPGVGSYTASAISAFAYDTFAHPVLETNIRTVLIEYFHQGETDIHDGVLYDDLSRLEKNSAVQKAGARTWYYALMDYGAYLKSEKISHNKKSYGYTKQSPFKGSIRDVRAKVLFAITHRARLPDDSRVSEVLSTLEREGFIQKKGKHYTIL